MRKPSTTIRISAEARAILKALADKLGISQAAVMEIALRKLQEQEIKTMNTRKQTRRMIIKDFVDGNTRTVDATPIFESDDYEFGHFAVDEGPSAVAYVHYWHTNRTFTTADWQGQQPQDFDDIPQYNWVDDDGNDAMIFQGLPTLQLHR